MYYASFLLLSVVLLTQRAADAFIKRHRLLGFDCRRFESSIHPDGDPFFSMAVGFYERGQFASLRAFLR